MKKLIKYLVVFIVLVVFFIHVNFKFIFFLFFFIFLEKKNLFGCGLNNYNQKGIFTEKYLEENLTIPTKIEFFKDIDINKIFAGIYGTFVKTKSSFF
jgi:hypothetical protein